MGVSAKTTMSELLRIEAQRDEVPSTVLERTALEYVVGEDSFLKTDRQLPKRTAFRNASNN